MNINFEYYRIFYTVANCKSITKAANELMISQPAISKSIMNLEEQLGGKLFVRTRRGVVLTEEGEEFYHYISQAMEFINNAESKFTELINLDVGTIRIGVSTIISRKFLLPYLEYFHEKYPKINIQILTSVSTTLFDKLRQGLLDLLVLNIPVEVGNDLEIIKVKDVHDCFIVGKKYKDLVGKKLTFKDLDNYPLILQSPGSITRKYLDDFAASIGYTFNPTMHLSSFSLVMEFVSIGFGIGSTTEEYIQEELKSGKVYKIDVKPEIPKRGIGICYSKKNMPNFCTKKFMEIVLNDYKLK